MQNVIVYIILGLSILYLGWKYLPFFKKKKKSCGGNDSCGC